MPATLAPSPFAPIDLEIQEEARAVVRNIGDARQGPMTLHLETGEISLPDGLSQFLVGILHQMAEGGAVAVTTLPEELTTTTAADRLGVSRPTLMKMIRNGEIEAYKVKSHTRIATAEMFRFLGERHDRRRGALAELQKLDVEYPTGPNESAR